MLHIYHLQLFVGVLTRFLSDNKIFKLDLLFLHCVSFCEDKKLRFICRKNFRAEDKRAVIYLGIKNGNFSEKLGAAQFRDNPAE